MTHCCLGVLHVRVDHQRLPGAVEAQRDVDAQALAQMQHRAEVFEVERHVGERAAAVLVRRKHERGVNVDVGQQCLVGSACLQAEERDA